MINPRSRTHLFGVLLGIFGGVLEFLPAAREFIPPDQYGSLFIGVSVAVIVLRNITTRPVSDR